MSEIDADKLANMDKRTAVLENTVALKWDEHNKSSDIHWKTLNGIIKEMKDDMKSVKDKVISLPCEANLEKFKSNNKEFLNVYGHIRKVWGGIVVVVSAIIVSFFR